VAVAAGLVPLALGTDTAGSGRVPAGLQNIVGLKPSVGLVSAAGVVPACRTLDCVSVLALTVDDAFAALAAMAGPDAADPYRRPPPPPPAPARAGGGGAPRPPPVRGSARPSSASACSSGTRHRPPLMRRRSRGLTPLAPRSSRSTSSRSTRRRGSSMRDHGLPSATSPPAR